MTVMIMAAGADIFRSKAQVLVNPVDCTGAQGKGLALEFKRRFSPEASCFASECRAGSIRPGFVFLVGNKDTNSIHDIDLGLIVSVEIYEPRARRI